MHTTYFYLAMKLYSSKAKGLEDTRSYTAYLNWRKMFEKMRKEINPWLHLDSSNSAGIILVYAQTLTGVSQVITPC